MTERAVPSQPDQPIGGENQGESPQQTWMGQFATIIEELFQQPPTPLETPIDGLAHQQVLLEQPNRWSAESFTDNKGNELTTFYQRSGEDLIPVVQRKTAPEGDISPEAIKKINNAIRIIGPLAVRRAAGLETEIPEIIQVTPVKHGDQVIGEQLTYTDPVTGDFVGYTPVPSPEGAPQTERHFEILKYNKAPATSDEQAEAKIKGVTRILLRPDPQNPTQMVPPWAA